MRPFVAAMRISASRGVGSRWLRRGMEAEPATNVACRVGRMSVATNTEVSICAMTVFDDRIFAVRYIRSTFAATLRQDSAQHAPCRKQHDAIAVLSAVLSVVSSAVSRSEEYERSERPKRRPQHLGRRTHRRRPDVIDAGCSHAHVWLSRSPHASASIRSAHCRSIHGRSIHGRTDPVVSRFRRNPSSYTAPASCLGRMRVPPTAAYPIFC